MKRNEQKGNIFVLVLPAMAEKAAQERKNILSELGIKGDRFRIIEGDITKEGLSISNEELNNLQNQVTHVFHLAAIYDLAVPHGIAYNVNVIGTNNVNEWVKGLSNLERYVYFSTAYVVGKREGTLYETELIKPESFKNHYEKTKFEAEVLVDQLKKDVPITIIRPGVVKGHSQTGETIKFDGPYFIMNFIDRLKFLPVLPRLGKGEAYVNLVPVDYIIQATAYLSFNEIAIAKTYHLTDPKPYRASEIYEMILNEMLNKRPTGTLPLALGKGFLSLKLLRKFLGVEKEALDYFTWMGHFDCTQAAKDLESSGIICPDFKDGVKSMTEFYLKRKDNPNYQVKII